MCFFAWPDAMYDCNGMKIIISVAMISSSSGATLHKNDAQFPRMTEVGVLVVEVGRT